METLELFRKPRGACRLSSLGNCAGVVDSHMSATRRLGSSPPMEASRYQGTGKDPNQPQIAQGRRGRIYAADRGRLTSCSSREGHHHAGIQGSKIDSNRRTSVSPARRKEDDAVLKHAVPHVPAATSFPTGFRAKELLSSGTSTQGPDRGGTTSPQGLSLFAPLRDLVSPASSSILLLDLLAALYGSNTVASKLIDASAADLPASLTTLVRYGITTLAFLPALTGAALSKQPGLLLAGSELGLQTFLGYLCGAAATASTTGSNASLLFTFTVLVVPLMEVFAGRSVSKLTWGSTLAALTAMGLLEWEGANVHDVLAPHLDDTWPLLGCALSAAHVFRSESLSSSFDSLHLTAVQLGVMTLLSVGWEGWSLLTSDTHADALSSQLASLPWGALFYSGLVCAGLCQWAELKSLRHVPAPTATLIYTTVPLWGALLSFLIQGELPESATTLGATLLVGAALGRLGLGGALGGLGNLEALELPSVSAWSGKRYFPQASTAALLSTQLKLPFYAAEAQRILAETKLQLAAAKSALDSWSSTIVPSTPVGCSSQPPPSVACETPSESRTLSDATALPHSTTAQPDFAPTDEAIHAVGDLANRLSHVINDVTADLTSQAAREGLQIADSLTQLWTAQPAFGWMAHALGHDGGVLGHLVL